MILKYVMTIYFVNELTKEVEIIDIGPRKSIYKKWD